MTDNPENSSPGRRAPRRARKASPRAAGAASRPARLAARPVAVQADDGLDQAGGKGPRGADAYRRLREAIATGALKPGARVLESELAARFDMSRTPIREAIAMLEADGLVSTDSARGRVVTKLDYQSVMELYVVREVLEATAAGLAARNASDMEIVALREMLELEEAILDDPGKLADHNRRFHEAIYYSSHNRYIVKMLQHLQTGMLLLQPAGRTGSGRRDTALLEHRAIVDAIETRDSAAAEAAMRLHVRRAQQVRIKMLLQNG